MRTVRVVRVLEYVGPEEAVTDIMTRVVRGTVNLPRGVTLTAATISTSVIDEETAPIVHDWDSVLNMARTEPQDPPWVAQHKEA